MKGNVTRILGLSLIVMLMLLAVSVTTAQDEVVMVIGWEQEPPNIQPINSLQFAAYMEDFYARNLWDWDKERNAYPIMVSELPSIENGMVTTDDDGNTTVTVHLREGIFWSDGMPITSADCELNHRLMSDRATSTNMTRARYPELVTNFEVIDDLTFAVTYDGLYPDFLAEFEAPTCLYPAHIFGPMIEDGGTLEDSDYFTGGQQTVGYGPYVMTQWNIGENMIFEPNEYWDGVEPAIDRFILQFITDDAQMRNALAAGDIDVAFAWSDDLQSEYAGIMDVETFAAPGISKDALWMRTGPIGNEPQYGGDAMQDPLVRQAITYALDRETFVEQLVGPGVSVPRSWYPDNLLPDDFPYLEYNPDRARELLAEAGWEDTNGNGTVDKDGIELDNLRLGTSENTLRNNYQLVIQEALAEVGIGVDVQIIPAGTFFASFADRGTLPTMQWELAIFYYTSKVLTPTGDSDLMYCEQIPSAENPNGWNQVQFCDAEFEALDTALASTMPGEERDQMAQDAIMRVHEGYFWVGLRDRVTWWAVNSARFDVDSISTYIGTIANDFNQIEYWQPAG